jgi:transcription elongation factor GreA
MAERIPITKEGLEKLKADLHQLLSVERPSIQKAIAEAREHGDLKENAEYHAAKEKQSFIEGRIQQINGRFANLEVVNPAEFTSESIAFGATVTIENLDTEETSQYQIVGPDEANIEVNRISFQSPVARALIGGKVGDVVTLDIPKGKIQVEITEVLYQ